MDRLVRRIEQIFMVLAVICMVLIMLIVACDAFGRYAINAPLPWSFEVLTNFLLIALTYFAISSTFQRGDHIGVDLFYNMMRKRGKAWCDIVSAVLAALLFAVITYGTWQNSMSLADRGAVNLGYLSMPAWLSFIPISIGSGLLVLRLVAHVITLFRMGEDSNLSVHGDAT